MKNMFAPAQPEGLSEISRGLSESASDTPGKGFQNELQPEGVREFFARFVAFLHPFRVRELFSMLSGGIAALNPRLISCTRSACLGLLTALVFLFVAGVARVNAAEQSTEQWGMFEIALKGPTNGNPFLDVRF